MIAFRGFPFVLSFFPVFSKLRDVQPLLILTADFQNYLLICLTRLRLSFLELTCNQVLPILPEFHILTADFQNYLLICLTRLRLSFLELTCIQVLPILPEFHIFL